MLAKRGQSPKNKLKHWIKDSKVLLSILESLNDRDLSELVKSTNRNLDKINKYIDNLPKKEFIKLITGIQKRYRKESQRR